MLLHPLAPDERPLHALWRRWSLLTPIGATLIFLQTENLPAAESPPARVDRGRSLLADTQLTSQARNALADDDELAALNLGVSVRDHVATLWGQVASTEIGPRAVGRLKKVPGIAEVVNQLVVEKADDPLLDFLRTPRFRPEEVLAQTPEEPRPAIVPERKPTPTRSFLWRPAKLSAFETPDLIAPLLTPETTTPVALPLMPAILLPVPPRTDVEREVERLRHGNERFSRVEPEVKGGIVYLRGRTRTWEDVYELARKVSLLPGVERVVLDNLQPDTARRGR